MTSTYHVRSGEKPNTYYLEDDRGENVLGRYANGAEELPLISLYSIALRYPEVAPAVQAYIPTKAELRYSLERIKVWRDSITPDHFPVLAHIAEVKKFVEQRALELYG